MQLNIKHTLNILVSELFFVHYFDLIFFCYLSCI